MDEIIKIELFGEEFRFKPDDHQQVDPERIAAHVEEHIKEAEGVFQNKASHRNRMAILLLAAMNLSKEYHELQQKHQALETDVENRISSLLKKIDQEIE